MKQETIVGYDEIFVYAKERYNVEWNKCCDIFHSGAILCTDKGRDRTIDLTEKEEAVKDNEDHPSIRYPWTEDKKLGYKIVIEFMKEYKLESMHVTNDF